jgi:hypothetical protein
MPTLLYDSSTIGRWRQNPRVIRTGQHDPLFRPPFCNGKGLEPHASGQPRFAIDGKGVGTLQADSGHGRIYVDTNNYYTITDYFLKFNDNIIDNHTCQTQSRHQEGGANTNRFGGVNFMIDRKRGGCGTKIELYHGTGSNHIEGPTARLPKPIGVGQWVQVKASTFPNQAQRSIFIRLQINYGQGFLNALQYEYKNLPSYTVYAPSFQQRSYFWLRVNNTSTGSVSFMNVRQYTP